MDHQERKKNIFTRKFFFLTTLFFQEICLCNINFDHKKTKQIKNSKKILIRKEIKYFQEIYFSLHFTQHVDHTFLKVRKFVLVWNESMKFLLTKYKNIHILFTFENVVKFQDRKHDGWNEVKKF